MDKAFTEGPWKAIGNDICDNGGNVLGTAKNGVDANLMAKAPTMYLMLKNMLDHFQRTGEKEFFEEIAHLIEEIDK